MPDNHALTRRSFLTAGLAAAILYLTPVSSIASIEKIIKPERALSFFNTHTDERLSVVYWAEGKYVAEGLQSINHILRDHHSGDIRQMDPELLDLLYSLRRRLGSKKPLHIISGYRSPKTNAMLRTKSSGVGRNSLHMQGKAIDIRVPGVRLRDLRRAAVDLKAGGVGYYPSSDFVHVDIGSVRYW